MYSFELVLSLGLAAFLAGVVNAVAGGGTLLTFPALLTAFAWMEPATAAVVANATSTLALVPGTLASAWEYRTYLAQTRRWLILLLGPSVIGGIIGALLMTRFPGTFAGLVPWLLLLAAVLFLFDTLLRQKHTAANAERGLDAQAESRGPAPVSSRRAVATVIFCQLLVSIYGGYFGAGVGIVMLTSLAMMGFANIHQMNALKTTLSVTTNGVSAIIFIAEDTIIWPVALSMALTASIGGYLGARLAMHFEPRLVRWAVIVIAFSLAGYYFFKKYW